MEQNDSSSNQTLIYHELVRRMMDDENFRVAMVKDPQAALQEYGISHDEHMIQSLRKIDYDSISQVMKTFNNHAKSSKDLVC